MDDLDCASYDPNASTLDRMADGCGHIIGPLLLTGLLAGVAYLMGGFTPTSNNSNQPVAERKVQEFYEDRNGDGIQDLVRAVDGKEQVLFGQEDSAGHIEYTLVEPKSP